MRISAHALQLAAVLAASAGVVAGSASTARAERRVVVLDFDGTRSPILHEDVRDLLEARFELVPSRTYERAARRMHAETFKAPHVARVSHAIAADAVVGGRLEKRRDHYVLHLRIFSGADGELLKGFAVALRDRSMSRGLRHTLSRKLGKTIARARVTQHSVAPRAVPRRAVARSERRRPVTRSERRHPVARGERRRPVTRKTKTRTASKQRRVRRSRAVRRAPARRSLRKPRARTAHRSRAVHKSRRAVNRSHPRAVRRATRRPPRRRVKRHVDKKPFKIVEKTDDRGNVIDDEIPAALRK